MRPVRVCAEAERLKSSNTPTIDTTMTVRLFIPFPPFPRKIQELNASGCPPGLTCFDFANNVDGKAWGFEASATWAVTESWRLDSGYTYMRLEVDVENPIADPLSKTWEGKIPRHQFQLRSRLNLPWELEFDAALYWVQELKSLPVESYERLDLRLGWRPLQPLELSLVGQNLTRRRHQEFENAFFSLRSEVPRSVYGTVTWRY